MIPPTVAADKKPKETKLRPILVKAPDPEVRETTTLQFSPYAWAKLKFMCGALTTEIGGMGITDPDDPMLVVDILIPKQIVSAAYVRFDDAAYADLMFTLCDPDGDFKMQPSQCQRIWVHTHPGNSPYPSSTDEATFARTWGACDWAIMFILAKGGDFYARLEQRHAGGLETATKLEAMIRWDLEFPAICHEELAKVIQANVEESYYVDYTYGARHPLWSQGVDAVRQTKSISTQATTGAQGYQEPGYGYYGARNDYPDNWYDDDGWFRRTEVDRPRLPAPTPTGTTKPPPPPGGTAGKTLEEKRFDEEANRDLPGGFKRLAAPAGWAPKPSKVLTHGVAAPTEFGFRYHDLLYFLGDYGQVIARGDDKLATLTDEERAVFEEVGIKITGTTGTGGIMVSYYDKDSRKTYAGPASGLLRFSEFDTPVRFDLEVDLNVSEAVMKRIAAARDPKMSGIVTYTDHAGQPIDKLFPWVCADGTTVIWLAMNEIDLLADVRGGLTSAERFEWDLWQYEQEVNDENETREMLVPVTGDEAESALIDAFDTCVTIIENARINIGMVDVSLIETGFANLLKGAKTGGWDDVCLKVQNAFRRNGYSAKKTADELNLEIINPKDSKSTPQPTVDEANEALKREE